MSKIKEIYKQNIYGVIGTLTFHIIILVVLLTSNLQNGIKPAEQVIAIDLKAAEIKLPEPEKEKKQAQETAAQPTQAQPSGSSQRASNGAVNDANKSSARSSDPFFDKEYNNEIAAAQKLVSDVNKNLARKIPKIGDIPMPEDNTKGKTREEVQQSNFKGKSNIHYFLENRFHARLPIPIYLAEGGGEVIVDIVVGRDGHVIIANPRPNPKISDMTILAYAQQAAEKTWFNEDPSAPEKQKGTITYKFVSQ